MNPNSKIKIGTRASKLAVCQAQEVKNAILDSYPEFNANNIEIIKITTSGDRLLDQKISVIGNKGLFTKEIEDALLRKDIDIAVHSMKDLPNVLPRGLIISAVLKREDASDAFVSNKYDNINSLPEKAIIATSSIRRRAMLLKHRADLQIADIRGNIITRLEKLDRLNIDGIILASAGLKRINKEDRITEIISSNIMLPAVGQGALGIECREDNQDIIEILSKINHQETEICINAERNFMHNIGGDCNTPIACYAYIKDEIANIESKILHPENNESFSIKKSGPVNKINDMVREISDATIDKGSHIINFIKSF